MPLLARCALLGAALASAVAAAPAPAALGPAGVRDGRNITVFHNIDMVATFGHGGGQQVQVDLVRGGHVIATSRGPAVGDALEVNHGLEAGAPQPGDCWEGATPDVRPGDLVRVTSEGGTDEAVVDGITIAMVTTVPNAATGHDEVWVQGAARAGDTGAPLDLGAFDSSEFRGGGGDLRILPNSVGPGAAEGTYVVRYHWPFRFDRGAASERTALAELAGGAGHMVGFGHLPIAGALPKQGMLVDGQGDAVAPAVGCEGSPAHPSSVGAAGVRAVNAAAMAGLAPGATALTVGGWLAPGTADAAVQLTDGHGGVRVRALADVAATAAGPQPFGAGFTAEELGGLQEGTLTARLAIGGTPAGAPRELPFDTVAPTLAVSLEPGTYVGARTVTLTSEDRVTYQLDGGAVRTNASPVRLLPGAHTVVVRVRDAAGNEITRTLEYMIEEPPAQPVTVTGPGLQAVPAPPVAVLAPAPAAAPGAPAPAPPAAASQAAVAPVARMLGSRRRIALARARRVGLTAVFAAPAGSRRATVRAYRVDGGRLTAVGARTVRIRAGRASVPVDGAATRRRLRPGVYLLEVWLTGAGGARGEPATAFVRVLR